MYLWESAFTFLVALVATYLLTRKFISRFHEGGHVVRDMYKQDYPDVPTMGGISILGGCLLAVIASQILIHDIPFERSILTFYFIIFTFGFFGLLDDLINVKSRLKKVYVLYILALPIALLNIDTSVDISYFGISWELGWLKSFIIAPVFVMVVANLVNMHAGFNGLDSGLSLILLFSMAIKALLKGQQMTLLYLAPIAGAILAFLWFNKYPARIFPGNSGSLMFGAAVGSLLVVYNMEFFGVVILIPHIINFLMWIYWSLNMHIHPHIKFAEVLPDGTIKPPNKLTMKYLVTSVFRVNEVRATYILYGITAVFCVLGLILIP